MPVYQCALIGIQPDDSQLDRIAEGITRIHSEETQAPEPFIRVVFTPIPGQWGYTAGKRAPSVVINAGIRSGRSDATRHAIMHRLHALVLEVVGVPAGQVVIATVSHNSNNLMEAGLVMPQANPQDEAAWFEKLEEAGSIEESRAAA